MQVGNRVVDASSVTKFELGKFSHEALLSQSGYLTITEKEVNEDNILYHLDYPNYEVQRSFNKGFADHLTGCVWPRDSRGRKYTDSGSGRERIFCVQG